MTGGFIMTTQPFRDRSLFWPLIFIAVGLIWLLANLNILQAASIQVLFRLWPLVLIVIGLDLLLGRNNPRMGMMIGVGGAALIIVLMLVGPRMGIVSTPNIQESFYLEPVEDATAAKVNLNLSVAETKVKALSDSNELIRADLRYMGEIDFNVSGSSEKVVTLSNVDTPTSYSFWDFGLFNGSQGLRWDVGLSPKVPIAMNISGGVGSTTLDLSELQLTDLRVTAGVGSINLDLPSVEKAYDADLTLGTGSADIRIEQGAAVNITVKGGVGSVNIDVPDDAAVKVEATTGLGSVNVPSAYTRLSGDNGKPMGEDGIWQSDNFDGAARQIVIHFEGGVGGLTIR